MEASSVSASESNGVTDTRPWLSLCKRDEKRRKRNTEENEVEWRVVLLTVPHHSSD